MSPNHAPSTRLWRLAILAALLLTCLAPGVPTPASAQSDATTPTPLAPSQTASQATPTPAPGAETTSAPESAPPCAPPCLVTIALNNSPVYALAGADSPRLASFASGISLYALGMDATTGWIELQIAPYTTGWIERNNLSDPPILSSLPVVATPLPIIFTPTPASLSLNAWVEYNNAKKSISIRIKGDGFRNNEMVRFELYNPSGKLVQKQTIKANAYNDVFATFILGKYTGGTYKILVYRDDGAILEKTVSVKNP